jgi:hypothetical protein
VFVIARRTVVWGGSPLAAATLLANTLVFTPKQGETWLTSCAVGSAPIACLSATFAILLSRLGAPTRMALSMVLCTAATYSYGNGLSTWLLAAPVVVAFVGWRALGVWTIASALNVGSYFLGYFTPAGMPSLSEGLRPARLAHYFLAFAGAPWGIDHLGLATIVGGFLIACFSGAVLYLVKRRDEAELRRAMLPWLALGGFTLASGLLSGVARSPWGVAMALMPRYVVTASCLAIACLFLVPIVVRDAFMRGVLPEAARRVVRWAGAVAVAVVLILQAGATTVGIRAVAEEGGRRRFAKSCLLLSDVILDEECLSNFVYPAPGRAQVLARELHREGLLRPGLLTMETFRSTHAPASQGSASGVFEAFSRTTARRHVAMGWAGSPSKAGPADAVILALEGPDGRWAPWRLVPVLRSRPDLTRARGRAFAKAGWRRPVPGPELPERPFRIGAWALDATTGVIAPLAGTHELGAEDPDPGVTELGNRERDR